MIGLKVAGNSARQQADANALAEAEVVATEDAGLDDEGPQSELSPTQVVDAEVDGEDLVFRNNDSNADLDEPIHDAFAESQAAKAGEDEADGREPQEEDEKNDHAKPLSKDDMVVEKKTIERQTKEEPAAKDRSAPKKVTPRVAPQQRRLPPQRVVEFDTQRAAAPQQRAPQPSQQAAPNAASSQNQNAGPLAGAEAIPLGPPEVRRVRPASKQVLVEQTPSSTPEAKKAPATKTSNQPVSEKKQRDKRDRKIEKVENELERLQRALKELRRDS